MTNVKNFLYRQIFHDKVYIKLYNNYIIINTKVGDIMNYYKKSLKEFKKKVKKNKTLTKEEWDKYAIDNCLFSSFTLEAHADVYKFDDLKKKYIFI